MFPQPTSIELKFSLVLVESCPSTTLYVGVGSDKLETYYLRYKYLATL